MVVFLKLHICRKLRISVITSSELFTGWKWSLKFSAFYKYSVWEKNHSVFLIFPRICKKIDKKNNIPGIFWAFKSKLQIILAATYMALFLPETNNCFRMCIIPYIHICFYYFLILCFYFHLLFFTLLATKHILQFTMFHIISLQTARNITEIKMLHSPRRKKKMLNFVVQSMNLSSLLIDFLFSFCSD